MKKRFQVLTIMLFFVASISSYSIAAFSDKPETDLLQQEAPKATDNCVACHQKHQDDVMSLFASSTHARRKLSCDGCHGGNRSAQEKAHAHAGNFIGKPAAGQILGMCGSCHQTQMAIIKTGRHIQEDGKTARVDCVQCHGAHLVGSSITESNFALLCSNCHGLEYLPELPIGLRKILSATDEVKNALRELQKSGRQATDSVTSLRSELRKTIGGIVHSTNASEAKAHEQQLLEISNRLKQQIQDSKN